MQNITNVIRFRNYCYLRWRTYNFAFDKPNSMNRLLSSNRFKWIFVIGLVAIGAGFTAKNMISYPTECTTPEMVTLR